MAPIWTSHIKGSSPAGFSMINFQSTTAGRHGAQNVNKHKCVCLCARIDVFPLMSAN